ncbi:AIDA repeat-containing protein, partial [Escherichia coli]|nr:autotransporter outer membrane beta-barrel domain-containing protein [Escherichia coli]EGI4448031.1 autotransporter outer membrane beta-barrel domain-containing protein [Escherichia coli]EHP6353159.1 AIDA repeat-containing protein [Escherichia coli]EJB6670867.1 AIDA repeat-containing protein [Escherichia coli]EJC4882303.1 AIDA repeat-containing protein [Escherichia coli]
MNKVYNTVWNESIGMWVVTSELTRKGGQRPRQIRRTVLAGLVAGLLLPSAPTLATAWDSVTLGSGGTSGSMTLNAGDTANNTTINSGGQQYVSSGGSATSTTVSNGGQQYVYSGGSATSTTINSGGRLSVFNGSAVDITQNSGGAISTDTSSDLSGANAKGSFSIAGGSANNMLLENGGYLMVLDGHQASDTTVGSYGTLGVV